MLRKIWLEDMVRVSFDELEKVVVSSIEHFGDDRRVSSAVAQPFAATYSKYSNESRRTWSAAEHGRTGLKISTGKQFIKKPVRTIDYLHRSRAQGCQSAMTIFLKTSAC